VAIDGKRLGYLEHLILGFASKHTLIQAASVREYLKQQDIEADLRRIHDALQRLLKKGIIEKVSRGIYKVTEYGKKLLSALISKHVAGKETDTKAAAFDGNMYVNGGFPVFVRGRLHVRGARSLEDLVRQLYAMYRTIGCVLRYLKQVLGKNRFYRIVRGVHVECIDFFVGGHGTSALGKSRSLKRPLISLDYFYSLGIKPREIGVDVFVASNVKPGVKAYFG